LWPATAGEGFIVDLPERQGAAGGMEGAGGKCRQGRQGCRATPDYRPLARRSRSGRRSLRKQTSEPLLKNGVFGKGEKACSRGLKKEFF